MLAEELQYVPAAPQAPLAKSFDLHICKVTVSEVVSVSESEAVDVNVTGLPVVMLPEVLETAVNVGAWLTLKGEPASPDPWDEAEQKEAALWSQAKPYQPLLSESAASAV